MSKYLQNNIPVSYEFLASINSDRNHFANLLYIYKDNATTIIDYFVKVGSNQEAKIPRIEKLFSDHLHQTVKIFINM